MQNVNRGPLRGVDRGLVPFAEEAPTQAEIEQIAQAVAHAIAQRVALQDAIDEADEQIDATVAATRRGDVVRPTLYVVAGRVVLAADERPRCVAITRRGDRCRLGPDFESACMDDGLRWVYEGGEEQFLAQTCPRHTDGSAASYLPVEWTPVLVSVTEEGA